MKTLNLSTFHATDKKSKDLSALNDIKTHLSSDLAMEIQRALFQMIDPWLQCGYISTSQQKAYVLWDGNLAVSKRKDPVALVLDSKIKIWNLYRLVK